MTAATSTFDQLAGPVSTGTQPVFADYLLVALFALLVATLATLPFAGRDRMLETSLSAPAADLTNSFLP